MGSHSVGGNSETKISLISVRDWIGEMTTSRDCVVVGQTVVALTRMRSEMGGKKSTTTALKSPKREPLHKCTSFPGQFVLCFFPPFIGQTRRLMAIFFFLGRIPCIPPEFARRKNCCRPFLVPSHSSGALICLPRSSEHKTGAAQELGVHNFK